MSEKVRMSFRGATCRACGADSGEWHFVYLPEPAPVPTSDMLGKYDEETRAAFAAKGADTNRRCWFTCRNCNALFWPEEFVGLTPWGVGPVGYVKPEGEG